MSTDKRKVRNVPPTYQKLSDIQNLSQTSNTSDSDAGETNEISHPVWQLEMELSTAALSVIFCIIICIVFIFLSLQTRFDGDFMGGLVHSLLVIVISVMVFMAISPRLLWPQLWYGGVTSYFLWFFHRLVVFPLITVIFPFTIPILSSPVQFEDQLDVGESIQGWQSDVEDCHHQDCLRRHH